mgnify:CR=1 FL=1
MAEAPTPEELGPLLGETGELDEPAADPYADENGEFMAAAMAAVGSESKAMALRDAFEAYCREKGLIGNDDPLEGPIPDDELSDVGDGFPDL